MQEVWGTPQLHHLWLSPVHLSLQLSQHLPLQTRQHLMETRLSKLLHRLPGGTGALAAAPAKLLIEPSLGDWNTSFSFFFPITGKFLGFVKKLSGKNEKF